MNVSEGSLITLLRLWLYYVQRLVTSRRLRQLGTRLVLRLLPFLYPSARRTSARSPRAHDFFRNGITTLGCVLDSRKCADIHAYLANEPVIDTRGSGRQYAISDRPAGSSLIDYSLHTVVNCPHILELANCPDLLQFASEILGCTPTIANISLRWSFPSNHNNDDVQHFHRDVEFSSFKILIYLTDVSLDSGPHVYVVGSHLDRMPMRLRRYSDVELVQKGDAMVTVTGDAGTAFAIDAKGIHKGEIPAMRPRLMLGIQYSLLPGLLYDYAPALRHSTAGFDT
ncbi:MAG: phytanoyl-CoA dioxygenase family protein [Pseudomonadota bacterium]